MTFNVIQQPEKKCTPLKCKTFSKIATSPVKDSHFATIPPLTVEETRPVDKIVVNCPYRTPKCGCTNEKEQFTGAVY